MRKQQQPTLMGDSFVEEGAKTLTSKRKPPKAKQKTSGPARSVSSKMLFSVVLKGLSTDNV